MNAMILAVDLRRQAKRKRLILSCLAWLSLGPPPTSVADLLSDQPELDSSAAVHECVPVAADPDSHFMEPLHSHPACIESMSLGGRVRSGESIGGCKSCDGSLEQARPTVRFMERGPKPARATESQALTSISALLSTILPLSTPATNRITVVDTMVVYTPEARTGAGGTEAVRSRIDLAVAEANTVFQNSHVDVRLRLVYVGETDYAEYPNNSTNLNRLKLKTDGFLDSVHSLRETNRADLVCLVTEYSDPGVSGLAFTMRSPSWAFRDSAFSVVKRADLVGTFIFVHEICHNFGAQHDREHAFDEMGQINPGCYPYSFGHRLTANGMQYRDVMSYAPGAPIPYLSNPEILFEGVPTGLPGITNGANNALTVNSNAIFVASFFGAPTQTFPPSVALVVPSNGLVMTAGTDLALVSQATDADGGVRQVEFYHENVLIGNTTSSMPSSLLGLLGIDLFGSDLYSVTWSNVPAGKYTLTARAVDDAGASSAAWPIELTVRPANDSFTNRIALSSNAPSVFGSNREATHDPGEAMHGRNPGGSSVWYSWVAPKAGTVKLIATGFGIVPLTEVYKSLTSTTLVSVANEFAADLPTLTSQTTFDAATGVNYAIAVDSATGTSGEFSLTLVYQDPPSNDDFANRLPLSGAAVAFHASNFAATSEPGEPIHAENPGRKSIWYSWIAPKSGIVLATVSGADFYPLAEVYSGASLSSLTVDPSRSFVLDATNKLITLSFDAVEGRDYTLAVDGYLGGAGALTFRLEYPPAPSNDAFAFRIPLTGHLLSVQTSNLNSGKETAEPGKHAGVASARSIWYSWTAPVSGQVTLSSQGDRFITWSAAYTGDSIANLVNAPGLSVRYNTNTLTTAMTFNAVAFSTYAIVLDGFNNKSGLISFTLATANSPPAVQSLAIPVALGGGPKLSITGSAGQRFVVQASTDLVGWGEIYSGAFVTNRFEFSDTNSFQFPVRFYRAMPLP